MKMIPSKSKTTNRSIGHINGIVVLFNGFQPQPGVEVEVMLTGHGHLHEGKPRVIFARVVEHQDILINCTNFAPDPFGFSAKSLDEKYPFTLTPGRTQICINAEVCTHQVWIRLDHGGRTRYRLEGLNKVEDFDWWHRTQPVGVQTPCTERNPVRGCALLNGSPQPSKSTGT